MFFCILPSFFFSWMALQPCAVKWPHPALSHTMSVTVHKLPGEAEVSVCWNKTEYRNMRPCQVIGPLKGQKSVAEHNIHSCLVFCEGCVAWPDASQVNNTFFCLLTFRAGFCCDTTLVSPVLWNRNSSQHYALLIQISFMIILLTEFELERGHSAWG